MSDTTDENAKPHGGYVPPSDPEPGFTAAQLGIIGHLAWLMDLGAAGLMGAIMGCCGKRQPSELTKAEAGRVIAHLTYWYRLRNER